MRKNFLRTGAIMMALGVIFGAFGAHVLKDIVASDRLDIFETAVRYQMYHGLGLLLLGTLLYFRRTPLMRFVGWLFAGGTLLFSGSLYLLTFADTVALPTQYIGPLTPLGGLLLVAGWVLLTISTFQENEKRYRKSNVD